ncbi:HD domain-containing phosphohydrolase [Desulfitobacterium sp.]|uniref:HD domain-containing phosphohydrolase n=1 Tax=Desulfitobacterium sp. TaxID=49981 RepID=UPI002B7B7409|nr:HD domain-containing phosphohydrolase [Desulfitobacterium sp.]HVJ50780.1 HD domain-containing phosphohydrolase [Desulfitobacterium sp.]
MSPEYTSLIRRMWSFSKALDLALVDEEIEKGFHAPLGQRHGERVAYIALSLGKALKLSENDLIHVTMAGLLHDIGAVGGFRKFHGDSRLIREHCILGAEIVSPFPDGDILAPAIRYHHEAPDINHSALKKDPKEVPFFAKILGLADRIDVHLSRGMLTKAEKDNLIFWVKEHEGSLFFAEVVPAFIEIAQQEAFWLDLEQANLMQIAFEKLGVNGDFPVSSPLEDQFTNILAHTFADLIDQKSAFTARHSQSVSETAERLAKVLGWEEKDIAEIRVAGLLHDLGKLSVPRRILDKPGHLDLDEIEVIRTHTYYTYRLLNEAGFPLHVVRWAAYHHERLDGQGYPFALTKADLDTGSRLMTIADIFAALTEERPYRKALSEGVALGILEKGNGTLVDPELMKVAWKALS